MGAAGRQLVAVWALGGSVLGAIFPIAGWMWASDGADLTLGTIRDVHQQQPVMTIVATAPLVLAIAGAIAGYLHHRVHVALRTCEYIVHERTGELEKANNRLVDLMRNKDQFVNTVGHELRTPVTAVIGFADLIVTGGPSVDRDEILEAAQLIASQGRELSSLLDDLLVASRSELGTLSIARGEVDLSEMASECVWAFESSPSTSSAITARLHPALAWADPSRVRQVVRNLLTNAARYGGPAVIVETGLADGMSHIRVMDNGAGVPVEDTAMIFEPYTHSDATCTVSGSVGIGLSVSRTLANLMGGDLAYRRDDGWTIFELTLPSRGQPSEAESVVSTPAE